MGGAPQPPLRLTRRGGKCARFFDFFATFRAAERRKVAERSEKRGSRRPHSPPKGPSAARVGGAVLAPTISWGLVGAPQTTRSAIIGARRAPTLAASYDRYRHQVVRSNNAMALASQQPPMHAMHQVRTRNDGNDAYEASVSEACSMIINAKHCMSSRVTTVRVSNALRCAIDQGMMVCACIAHTISSGYAMRCNVCVALRCTFIH